MCKFVYGLLLLFSASSAAYGESTKPSVPGSVSSPQTSEASPYDAPAAPADMENLFNGRDLEGWDGDPRLWRVQNGAIRGETTAERAAQGNTFLVWQGGRTKDFHLRLAFRCNATNNSGIQYRSRRVTDTSAANAWVVRGYQHEVRNELMFPDVAAFIYDEGGKRGRLCLVGEKAVWESDGEKRTLETFLGEKQFRELFRLDDWNDVVIMAHGNHIQHFLNGRLVVDFTDNDPGLALLDGVLALQLHAGAPMWVEFKDIRWKSIP